MELSLVMRARIAAAMCLGGVVIGVIAWPLLRPSEAEGAICLFAGDISIIDGFIYAVLAFIVGFVAYFVCYPYGKEIAPLAVPAGIGVLAVRSGNMSSILLINNTLEQRQALFSALKLEGIFWLIIVAIGYLGVIAAYKFVKPKSQNPLTEYIGSPLKTNFLSVVTAIIGTVVVTQFALGIFAQDVKMFDPEVGSVVGQPGTGQIAFAVMVSFALAAFLIKYYLGVDYIFAIASSILLVYLAMTISSKTDVLSYMVEHWPVSFFTRSMCAILPIQVVSFAAIGAVAGFWIAINVQFMSKNK